MQRVAVLDGSPWLTAQLLRSGLVSSVSLFLFLCAWHWRVAGGLTLATGGALALLLVLYLLYGHLFAVSIARFFSNTVGLPFQLLAGYVVLNTLLFLLALCSPLGLGLDLAVLSLVGAAGAFAVHKRMPYRGSGAQARANDAWAPWLAILVGGVGATIWCGDIQAPLQVQDGMTVFQVWPDVYIHLREISVFAQSHGLHSIHDIKLAGGPAPLYHFASYLSAAAISAVGGASAMQAYAGFQLPFGILLVGLAAYCLAGSLLSRRAGVAAAAAVVLLPDGFLQGFANRYLSYYFLSQVNLGMLYGIACAALAWLFVLDGCRRGKLATVVLGYGFLAVCLLYKAHIFVANSYLLMMCPILFFTPLRLRWRLVLAIMGTLLFMAVVAVSQTNPRVPVLRLDGSGISAYLVQLLQDYDPGILKSFFDRVLLREAHAKPVQLLYVLGLLSLSTFGLWMLALPAALAAARKKVALPLLWFPLLVVANYLVMAVGLASDSRGVGTPDELLNRPLVWAYFVTAAWSAGLLCHVLADPHTGSDRRQRMRLRGLLAVAMLAAAAVSTLVSAPGLQTFPSRGFATFATSNAVPACLVDAAAFLRTHSAPDDVVHDAGGDARFVLTALSERQLYVGAVGFGGTNREQLARRDDMLRFTRLPDTAQVLQFAAARGIGWFLAHPGTALDWPPALSRQPAFSCGGFRLYRFTDAIQAAPYRQSLPT